MVPMLDRPWACRTERDIRRAAMTFQGFVDALARITLKCFGSEVRPARLVCMP
jgi:hypothetical protein